MSGVAHGSQAAGPLSECPEEPAGHRNDGRERCHDARGQSADLLFNDAEPAIQLLIQGGEPCLDGLEPAIDGFEAPVHPAFEAVQRLTNPVDVSGVFFHSSL